MKNHDNGWKCAPCSSHSSNEKKSSFWSKFGFSWRKHHTGCIFRRLHIFESCKMKGSSEICLGPETLNHPFHLEGRNLCKVWVNTGGTTEQTLRSNLQPNYVVYSPAWSVLLFRNDFCTKIEGRALFLPLSALILGSNMPLYLWFPRKFFFLPRHLYFYYCDAINIGLEQLKQRQ